MKKILLLCLLSAALTAAAQQNRYIGLAVYTGQNDLPFGKLTGLFREILHPGIEFSYGKILRSKPRHEWLLEYRAGYFYHRFVQHSIPLYASMGYRYKFNSLFSADLQLGAGYLHSVPATAKLRLNGEGEYENNKGVGRMQGTAVLGLGPGYTIAPNGRTPLRLFLLYQQRLQFPFVKSYVPLLPYNCLLVGVSRPLSAKKKS